jgi:hypothetical protein
LNRVDYAQDLVEIAAGGHRVNDHQLDLLVGPDDEYVCAPSGYLLRYVLRMFQLCSAGNMSVELRNLQICIANHRIIGGVTGRVFDVLRPARVVLHGINAQPIITFTLR